MITTEVTSEQIENWKQIYSENKNKLVVNRISVKALDNYFVEKYHPKWTGCGDTVHPVWVLEEYLDYFKIEKQEEFRVDIPFTRDSWNGRMRACRGTSASMTSETFTDWENEHIKMLEEYPEKFLIKHYISIAWLRKK